MPLFTRLATSVLVLSVVVPYVAATPTFGSGFVSCLASEFFFQAKGCCLRNGGQLHPPSPPTGKKCPSNGWEWFEKSSCCTPKTPAPPTPVCDDPAYFWNTTTLCCDLKPTPPPAPPAPTNSCDSGHFFWSRKNCCLIKGGNPKAPSPPSGKFCPKDLWSWDDSNKCCVPSIPAVPATPTCDSDDQQWNDSDQCCEAKPKPTKDSDCDVGFFFFHERSCCLRLGGPPTSPSPPAGKSCPQSTWSWDQSQACCTPHQPRPTPVAPSCDSSSLWSEPSLCCQSKASHGFFQKREGRSRM